MTKQTAENKLTRLINLLAKNGYDLVEAKGGFPGEGLIVKVYPPERDKDNRK
jgi:hypothetical protein